MQPFYNYRCVTFSFRCSYVQYSSIAARTVRAALKEPARTEAAKRGGQQIKITYWKDGKAISEYTELQYRNDGKAISEYTA